MSWSECDLALCVASWNSVKWRHPDMCQCVTLSLATPSPSHLMVSWGEARILVMAATQGRTSWVLEPFPGQRPVMPSSAHFHQSTLGVGTGELYHKYKSGARCQLCLIPVLPASYRAQFWSDSAFCTCAVPCASGLCAPGKEDIANISKCASLKIKKFNI